MSKREEREPIIYHGYSLTTKLPFRDVIHSIKVNLLLLCRTKSSKLLSIHYNTTSFQDYGFSNFDYPVIISIENHCSQENQKKMAMIFRSVFDEMLPKEDLVELEGRVRLPSPQELQGKIILKGKFKEEEVHSTKYGIAAIIIINNFCAGCHEVNCPGTWS